VELNLGKNESLFVIFPVNKGKYTVLPEIEVLKTTVKPVEGSWNVAFQPKLDKPFSRKFSSLADWSKQKEDALKYFSGTAKYEKTVYFTNGDLGDGKRILLDLGELHDIAELEINGKNAGVLWAPPYKTDITPYLKAGTNQIAIYIGSAEKIGIS
jgi:hypothetical protein